jgi:glycosyltransferase involved in cell wall biosynthesis
MKLSSRPVVLVVGSHEPRKNHLAVLHAAEALWQDGIDFTLTLVGASAWHAEAYEAELDRLQELGRRIQSLRGLSDELLWAAYRIAHCTVFPSLNEGFGLPVAESLAAGTPVITSDFGSMRDIVMVDGRPLGGLLVDPRDDASIADALRDLLTDRALHARLKEEASNRPVRTWDDYAAELWDYLMRGITPTAT